VDEFRTHSEMNADITVHGRVLLTANIGLINSLIGGHGVWGCPRLIVPLCPLWDWCQSAGLLARCHYTVKLIRKMMEIGYLTKHNDFDAAFFMQIKGFACQALDACATRIPVVGLFQAMP